MKRICILTATRAEYGLLSPLIKKMLMETEFDVRVAVTGMHLSPEFGLTWKEIEADGVPIDKKIEMLLSADSPAAITKSMSVAMMGFADYFAELKPDALMILGDRYEALAVCIAAMNARIPIMHIHGGEITEGAIDDVIRHSITKMSMLHFTSTEEYRNRVIQMGESPDRVFNVGALGVENALCFNPLTKIELEENIDWKLGDRYAVLTFHPVTLEEDTAEFQIDELLRAIERFPNIRFLATRANADAGGRIVNKKLELYAEEHEHLRLYDSLGMRKYLSAVKNAYFVMGNSSSGIMEAPALGVPTVNVGDRQKGRIKGNSIINCEASVESIMEAIKHVERIGISDFKNPYGDGKTSSKILEILKMTNFETIELKKKFYDL